MQIEYVIWNFQFQFTPWLFYKVSFSDPNLIEARSRIIKEEINVKGVHTKYMVSLTYKG